MNIYNHFDYNENQFDFKYIIETPLRKSPIRGSLKVTIDKNARYLDVGEKNMSVSEIVLRRLEFYCQMVHFECIVKEI